MATDELQEYLLAASDLGERAAVAVKHGDHARAAFHSQHLTKIKNLFDGDDRRMIEDAYREAYRHESGFYDKPKPFA